ncbi:MAG: NTP transferase domain-containing protein [Lachnospiraceae bacterium]|nr:NTP transferase domain-containing protein [Lachnospiraceae bacterium]
MKTAALIVAAGMDKQADAISPMRNLGSISVAQRIIATYHQSGIRMIAIVTGYQAEELEHHLSNNEVVFLRNPDYADTSMFDSVKIGLEYLKDKCDRVFLTPVNIPLFTSETVRRLSACQQPLACPLCEGKSGHPVLIAASLFDQILSDSGRDGIRGALARCGVEMTMIPVEDSGIFNDFRATGEYRMLLEQHNAKLVRPVVHVSLAREKPFFDAKVALLLNLVDETGSVRAACQRMKISYSGGWNMIRMLETQLHHHLIERSQGGAGGGKSNLTEEGRWFIRSFRRFEEELRLQANELFESCFEGFFEE